MRNPEPRLSENLVPTVKDGGSRWVHEVACRDCRICTLANRIMPGELEDFVTRLLLSHHVPEDEARITARVLVASDVRGIPSHGVARLSRYLAGIKQGTIRPGVAMGVTEPAPAIGLVDAANGLGQVAGELGMKLAIRKAEENGVGVVTVRSSNHYGIAGYYALMAVDAGLIGLSLTNSAPLVVPTHGADIMLGTNPIALGAPAIKHPPFLLDMATSVVPRGKIEVYDRNLHQMPVGWAVDENGYDCQNPGQVLKNLVERIGGGILPLGGRGEEYSGHKGYGLAFLVDILSGVLSDAAYGPDVDDVHGKPEAGKTAFPNVGHFFLAIDIARFMPLHRFVVRLDDYIARLKASRKAFDQQTVFIHGEKEFARAQVHLEVGVPLAQNVLDTLLKIAAAAEIAPPQLLPPSPECEHSSSFDGATRE